MDFKIQKSPSFPLPDLRDFLGMRSYELQRRVSGLGILLMKLGEAEVRKQS